MKIILFALSFFATAFLWVACKSTKYTPGNFPDRQLRWGRGGGFVGKETTYTLLDNGQIFSREANGELTAAGKIRGKKAKSLLQTAEKMEFHKMEFQHPGNTYNFVETLSGDAVSRIVWGDPNFPISEEVKALFEALEGLREKK
jgi:hypothetical protein